MRTRTRATTTTLVVTVSVGVLLLIGFGVPTVSADVIWTVAPSPNPAGTSINLSGVACPTATSCDAVGYFVDNGGALETLVEQWNGAAWTIVPSPNTSESGTLLRGVSCASESSCMAVGYGIGANPDTTVVEQWNGAAWTIVPSPNPPGSVLSELTSVSCPATNRCIAVGVTATGGPVTALIEQWDGSAWTIAPSPNSSGTALLSVSCISVSDCTAVGSSSYSFSQQTLIEHWDGTGWSVVASANQAGAAFSSLVGVSCTSTTFCMAVGQSSNGTNTSGLTEWWDGTAWTIDLNGPANGSLAAVSCPSAASCTAFGSDTSGSTTSIIEQWDGVNWIVDQNPAPAGSLDAVSCTAPTTCTAVGSTSYSNSLIETSQFGTPPPTTTTTTTAPTTTTTATTTTTTASTTTTTAGITTTTTMEPRTTCVVTGLRAGPPKQQDVTVQNPIGVNTITNIRIVNGTVNVPAFTPGTTAPIVVTATKTNQSQTTTWSFDVVDASGATTHCA